MKSPSIDIYGGRDPAEIASCTMAEAAHWLDLSHSTVRAWTVGQRYRRGATWKRFTPVIEVADPEERLLSFRNLVELHVLSAIRREHRVSLQNVRKAVSFLKRRMGARHPLATQKMLTDGRDLLVQHGADLLNASKSGQVEMKIADAYLERIDFGGRGEPLRLYPFTATGIHGSPRSVVIDPRIQFGRPCLSGTGIPTAAIVERFNAGEKIPSLADDYGLAPEVIEEAIRYECLPRAA